MGCAASPWRRRNASLTARGPRLTITSAAGTSCWPLCSWRLTDTARFPPSHGRHPRPRRAAGGDLRAHLAAPAGPSHREGRRRRRPQKVSPSSSRARRRRVLQEITTGLSDHIGEIAAAGALRPGLPVEVATDGAPVSPSRWRRTAPRSPRRGGDGRRPGLPVEVATEAFVRIVLSFLLFRRVVVDPHDEEAVRAISGASVSEGAAHAEIGRGGPAASRDRTVGVVKAFGVAGVGELGGQVGRRPQPR
jgi:hypothetical protein